MNTGDYEYWKEFCGADHEYMFGPIEGWRGVKDEKIRIGNEEEEFRSWLEGLKGRWVSRWEDFWRG